jgi:hypothetical protein
METRNPYIMNLSNLRCAQLGDCIRSNAPESLDWSFDVYEKDDAIAVIQRTALPKKLPHLLEMMEHSWYEQRSIVESALIQELKPYLNNQLNGHERDLPERYQRAKSGTSSSLFLNLGDNAVDYIDL